jgi:hypothetical protein
MRSPGADQVLLHGVVLFNAAFATVQLAVFSEFQFPRGTAHGYTNKPCGALDLQSALALGNGPPASHLLRTPGPSSALPPAGAPARIIHPPGLAAVPSCIGRPDQHAGRYSAGSQSRYLGLKDGQHLSIRSGCWPAYGRMNRSCDRGASLCRRWPFHLSRPGCRGVAAPGCLTWIAVAA